MTWLRGTLGMAMVILLAGIGCTRILDHETTQCQSDGDCLHFLHHPYCQEGLCVQSGLQPAECFFPTPEEPPTKPEDFLNACTLNAPLGGRDIPVGECLSFTRALDPGATLRDPPKATPPPPKTGPAPTALCKDLVPAGGSILYLSGSSNFQPLLRELAPEVVKTTGVRPVFRITTSCSGARSMNMLAPSYVTDHVIKDPVLPTESYAQIFLGDGNPGVNCLLGPGGVTVDIGESEIYPETCGPPANNPDDIAEGLGPILPMVFAVPKVSTERAISFRAAQQVFGGGGGVSPWSDPGYIFVRGAGTATLRLVAKELELVPEKVWGVDQGSAGTMATNLAAITDLTVAQTAIGIIGSDFYDFYRGGLKALAFQAKNQDCAFVPDSSLTSKDKINVRDGHYPLWGRIHFYIAKKDHMPVSELAQSFVYQLTTPSLDPEILDAFIDAGFVPPCAMKVRRETELGELTYDDPPPFSCGCAFDVRVNPGKTDLPPGCTECTSNGDCTTAKRPICNYGYCEAAAD